MTKEEKLCRERDEAIDALSTAQRNLSEAQKAYSRARKNYKKGAHRPGVMFRGQRTFSSGVRALASMRIAGRNGAR